MKKIILKPVFIVPFLALLIHGCSKEEALPEDDSLLEMEEIMSVRNVQGEVESWYYVGSPNEVYMVESTTTSEVATSSPNQIVSLVGDMDVFGFSPTRTHPPCAYFDMSGTGDLEILDRHKTGSSTEKVWVHDFTNNSQFCTGFTAETVTIQIKEYFIDSFDKIKILIDGKEYDFVQNGILSRCSGKTNTVQTFVFTGEQASFANDGIINISILENGEEFAIDYSLVTVDYSLASPVTNIVINGCDTGVLDQLRDCKSLSELINSQYESAMNHGQFVSGVADLAENLVNEGKLTKEDLDAIMSCTGRTK